MPAWRWGGQWGGGLEVGEPERGLALAPVVQALVPWGMASFTLTAPASASAPDDEVFDQTWTIPDPELVADETYEWP